MTVKFFPFLFITLLVLSSTGCGKKDRNQGNRDSDASTIDSGLVVYSSFNKIPENSLKTGTELLNGAKITEKAVVGDGAVYLDGEDDFISFPEGVYFKGDYSISIWCRFLDYKQWTRILDFNQEEPASGPAVTWLIGIKEGGKARMWFDQWVLRDSVALESILNFPEPDAYLGYDIPDSSWNHFVITYNSEAENRLGKQTNKFGQEVFLSGQVKLYVNGVETHTTLYCLKPDDSPTINNWLGRSAFKNDPFFKGYMDDFRIYDRVLDIGEVKELYKLGD